jgi:prepilin-type processing-associated H-X9-DG protein
VVIAIIGILVALLLPAVQFARESSRQIKCQNQLKQIGIAVHLHHDQFRYLPSGGWDWWEPPTYVDGTPQVGEFQRASWAFQILPQLEALTVWNGQGVTDAERSISAVGAKLPVFFCPSRRLPQAVTYGDPGYMGGLKVKHALCDYAGSNFEGTGVFRRYEPRSLADITDGTSTTLLVGEKRLNRTGLGSWQEDDNEGYTAGWDEDTLRRTDLPPLRDYSGSGDGEERFGSSHPSGLNAVFADGSVHIIHYTINNQTFNYMGNIGDNQVINPF